MTKAKTPRKPTAKKANADVVKDAPNVKFIGGGHDASGKGVKPGDQGFVPREPIAKFTDGMETVTLPPVEEQQKPFYFEHAARLVRLFPKLYKTYVEKGS